MSFQQERKESSKRMVGGAFKLNMHPKPLFKENPYKADKSLFKNSHDYNYTLHC